MASSSNAAVRPRCAPRAMLAPGSRLAPYEVLTLVGEGGMGQVFKARDTRLDRTVAITRSSRRSSAVSRVPKRSPPRTAPTLRDEPTRASSITPVTAAALDALIHECLAKDPNERWQNIADVAVCSSISRSRIDRCRVLAVPVSSTNGSFNRGGAIELFRIMLYGGDGWAVALQQ